MQRSHRLKSWGPLKGPLPKLPRGAGRRRRALAEPARAPESCRRADRRRTMPGCRGSPRRCRGTRRSCRSARWGHRRETARGRAPPSGAWPSTGPALLWSSRSGGVPRNRRDARTACRIRICSCSAPGDRDHPRACAAEPPRPAPGRPELPGQRQSRRSEDAQRTHRGIVPRENLAPCMDSRVTVSRGRVWHRARAARRWPPRRTGGARGPVER